MDKCVICGKEIPIDMTQLAFATKDKGIETACLQHEFSKELKDYITDNGGIVSIIDALHNALHSG